MPNELFVMTANAVLLVGTLYLAGSLVAMEPEDERSLEALARRRKEIEVEEALIREKLYLLKNKK